MKKFALLMLMAVLVLGLIASVVVAKGPANKATGSVWLEGEGDIHVEFDAHEFKDDRPVKGSVYWHRFGVIRLELDVICCKVVDETAWFATEPTYLDVGVNPIYGNQFKVFKVVDSGSPGYNDALSVQWVKSREIACEMVNEMRDPSIPYNIIDGNLVVHYYGEEE